MIVKLDNQLTAPGSPDASVDLTSQQFGSSFYRNHIWSRNYSGGVYHIFFEYADPDDTNDQTLPDNTVASPQDLWEAYQAQLPNPGALLADLQKASLSDISGIRTILGII